MATKLIGKSGGGSLLEAFDPADLTWTWPASLGLFPEIPFHTDWGFKNPTNFNVSINFLNATLSYTITPDPSFNPGPLIYNAPSGNVATKFFQPTAVSGSLYGWDQITTGLVAQTLTIGSRPNSTSVFKKAVPLALSTPMYVRIMPSPGTTVYFQSYKGTFSLDLTINTVGGIATPSGPGFNSNHDGTSVTQVVCGAWVLPVNLQFLRSGSYDLYYED